MVFPNQPSLCLISNGAECVMINKQFYTSHCSEEKFFKLQMEVFYFTRINWWINWLFAEVITSNGQLVDNQLSSSKGTEGYVSSNLVCPRGYWKHEVLLREVTGKHKVLQCRVPVWRVWRWVEISLKHFPRKTVVVRWFRLTIQNIYITFCAKLCCSEKLSIYLFVNSSIFQKSFSRFLS